METKLQRENGAFFIVENGQRYAVDQHSIIVKFKSEKENISEDLKIIGCISNCCLFL